MTKVYCSRWYEQRFSSASQSNLEFSHEIQRQKIQGVALCLEFPMRNQNFSLKNGMHTFHHINTCVGLFSKKRQYDMRTLSDTIYIKVI